MSQITKDNIDKISIPTTSCKDCAFAIYEDLVQKGCQLGKLYKYQEKGGIELLQLTDGDDGKTYYLIEGRFCLFCRNQEWKKKYGDDYLNQIHNETHLRYEAILFISSGFNTVKKIIQQLSTIDVAKKMERITIVLEFNTSPEITMKCIDMLQNSGYPWRVERKTDDITDTQIVDNVVLSNSSPFYFVLHKPLKNMEIISEIEAKIFSDLERFAILTLNKQKTNYLVNKKVHSYLGGSNNGIDLIDKIKDINKDLVVCV